MSRRVFKYTLEFKITKKELRQYGSFNFPDWMMDDIIENCLMHVAEGMLASGSDIGPGFITNMLMELKDTNAITLNEKGKNII